MKPVVGLPFESTKGALAYVEGGHARGKVIVKVRVRGVEAGLDEVKNSVTMNHAPRNLRLVESGCGLKT